MKKPYKKFNMVNVYYLQVQDFLLVQKITSKINLHFVLQNILHMNYTTNVMFLKKIKMTIYVERHNVWGIERSGFFNGREKWAKGFENQRV